jgi:galactose mutarotase-like enzyme
VSKIALQDHRLYVSEDIFANDALILRELKTTRIELWHNDNKILTFDRGNFPHFGIWKQKNAPFICLEPWCGFADLVDTSGVLNEKA